MQQCRDAGHGRRPHPFQRVRGIGRHVAIVVLKPQSQAGIAALASGPMSRRARTAAWRTDGSQSCSRSASAGTAALASGPICCKVRTASSRTRGFTSLSSRKRWARHPAPFPLTHDRHRPRRTYLDRGAVGPGPELRPWRPAPSSHKAAMADWRTDASQSCNRSASTERPRWQCKESLHLPSASDPPLAARRIIIKSNAIRAIMHSLISCPRSLNFVLLILSSGVPSAILTQNGASLTNCPSSQQKSQEVLCLKNP